MTVYLYGTHSEKVNFKRLQAGRAHGQLEEKQMQTVSLGNVT